MHRHTFTRFCLGAVLMILLSVWSSVSVQHALAWSSPIDLPLTGVGCKSTTCNIFSPRVAAEGNHFHLIYAQQDQGKIFYNRGTADASGTVTWETAVAIASNIDTGGNESWDIIADPNGTVQVAYYSSGSLYYIKNASAGAVGNWSSPERIDTTGNRAYGVAITLDATGVPYVAWGSGLDPGGLRFASRNSDGTWTPRDAGITAYFVRFPDIAVTGGGASAVVHVMAEVERKKEDSSYSIYYTRAAVNGTIGNTNFSSAFNTDSSNNRPTLAVDRSTNVLYSAFVAGNTNDGYYTSFSFSSNQGASWSNAAKVNLGTGFWSDLTPMIAANGTVYMMLPGKQVDGVDVVKIGFYDVRYNAASNSFSAPAAILNYADSNRKLARTIDYGINTVAKLGVWIRNFTDGPGYNSDPGGINLGAGSSGGGSVSGQLVINGGAVTTPNPTVTIAITNTTGNPTQMRVAVDTPLSSNTPLEPFQATFTRTFTDLSVCQHTVQVALVNADGTTTTAPLQGGIVVDAAIQASVVVGNPYKSGNAAVFSQLQDVQAVNDGDSSYTRVPAFYAEINGGSECSGLKQVSIGRGAGTYNYTQQIGANFYASPLYIPGTVVIGPNQIVLQVVDNVGNTQVFTRTIYYDPTPPVIASPGRFTVQAPTSGPNVLTTLTFNGVVVTDNMYPNGYWGVWIANSRTASTNPISDTNLVWTALQRPNANADFSLTNWSVLGGIPAANQTAGDYYVYVRFLDGAGNATNSVISSTVTLNQITKPTVLLPIVVR